MANRKITITRRHVVRPGPGHLFWHVDGGAAKRQIEAIGIAAILATQGTNKITYGKDGTAIPVQINVYQAPKSSVFIVEATSSNPQFTPDFLNALVNVYLEYKKNVRQGVSDDTLGSIANQIDILNNDLTNDQKVVAEYERSNNMVVITNRTIRMSGHLPGH